MRVWEYESGKLLHPHSHTPILSSAFHQAIAHGIHDQADPGFDF